MYPFAHVIVKLDDDGSYWSILREDLPEMGQKQSFMYLGKKVLIEKSVNNIALSTKPTRSYLEGVTAKILFGADNPFKTVLIHEFCVRSLKDKRRKRKIPWDPVMWTWEEYGIDILPLMDTGINHIMNEMEEEASKKFTERTVNNENKITADDEGKKDREHNGDKTFYNCDKEKTDYDSVETFYSPEEREITYDHDSDETFYDPEGKESDSDCDSEKTFNDVEKEKIIDYYSDETLFDPQEKQDRDFDSDETYYNPQEKKKPTDHGNIKTH